ncbi:MAG: hypothetical protein Q9182_000787 [Xanthomendoza sp. 2 TL-2023]
MPRTLPWLKDQRVSQSKSTGPVPEKRPPPLDPGCDSSDNARSVRRAKARQRRELAQRAGLSQDDIYIMVEDEFLSTAQLFTSHLHHAEYIRLKKAALARNTNSKSILQSATTSVTRPTDSVTAMRAETKRKKEAEARRGKNKAALERMKEDARRGIAVSSDDEDDLDSENDDEADKAPWAGTSLQGLMAPAARKNLTSLSGLQAIQSSTRAARGFTKPEDSQSQSARDLFKPSRTQDIPSHVPKPRYQQPLKRRSYPLSSSSSNNEADDDDDLDAIPPRPPPPPSKNHPSPPTPNPDLKKPKPKSSNPLTLAAQDLFHPAPHTKNHRLPPPSPPPPRHEPSSSSPPSSDNAEVSAARRRMQERRERAAAAAAAAARKRDGGGGVGAAGKGGQVNANEIPVFLV